MITIAKLTAYASDKKAPDLTVRQIALLAKVVEQRRITGEIATELNAPKSSVTRGAAKLKRLGLADSKRDTTDRRLMFVSATAAGRRFIAKHFGETTTLKGSNNNEQQSHRIERPSSDKRGKSDADRPVLRAQRG